MVYHGDIMLLFSFSFSLCLSLSLPPSFSLCCLMLSLCNITYIHTHTCIYIYFVLSIYNTVYVYIYRERERVCVCACFGRNSSQTIYQVMFGWQHHPTQKHDGFSVGHLRISNLTSSLAIFGCGKVKPYVLRINHGWHFRSNLLLFPPGSMHMFMANLLVQATCISVKTHIAYNFDPCMVSCWLNSSWSSKANYGFYEVSVCLKMDQPHIPWFIQSPFYGYSLFRHITSFRQQQIAALFSQKHHIIHS